ncbi:FadR/GntR family transcriptional regulator [Henriciella marina]|uniref:FCD domain-containing protein n=1 Tax=Henriciella marina TaxID=453851 RepID=A0ABT4LPZ8_9PROT|nr:FCD domain-containing protein [Henriciella marina]MCZ4296439.1 FCD domain-containing protein [Henriciella marina]
MSNKADIKSLKRSPAYQLAEEALRKMIMEGKLKPGEMLPVEHDLADQLGVTRPTVREALRKLESSGLVVRGARRRMVVSAPSPRIASDAMLQAIVLHGISYREIWQMHMALEPMAAGLAAETIDMDLLSNIEANLRHTEDVLEDPEALVEADIEFHDLIARASGNHALLLARAPIGEFLFPAYGAVINKLGPGQRLLDAHRHVFNALKVNDAETARDWMTKHIRDFLRGCEMAGLPIDEPVHKVNQDWNLQRFQRESA